MGGQILIDSNGNVDKGSGATLFKTDSVCSLYISSFFLHIFLLLFINWFKTLRTWTPISSPVIVPDTKDDVCPNYSTALVFLDKGDYFSLITYFNFQY